MENRWVRFAVNEMKEEAALAAHQTSSKDLRGALILVPEGTELSDTALDTLRHFRYYTDVHGGGVLLGEQTILLVDGDSLEEMLEEAEREAGRVTGRMPDFSLLPADDGCTLLAMGECTFTFRDRVIPSRSVMESMMLRTECLEACESCKPLAVIRFDGAAEWAAEA